MTRLNNWIVNIEYGNTAHDIVLDASSSKDAKSKAEKWAKDNNIENPTFSEPYEDNFDELSWTEAEEEEFIHLFENLRSIDES